MYQLVEYTLRMRKLYCKTKKRLGERFYKYNFYVYVQFEVTKDGIKRVSSNMSSLFENMSLINPKLAIESTPRSEDPEVLSEDDSSYKSSASLASDDISEDQSHHSIAREDERGDKVLSPSNIRPTGNWIENDPRMMKLGTFEVKAAPASTNLFDSPPANANKEPKFRPSGAFNPQGQLEFQQDGRHLYWDGSQEVWIKVRETSDISNKPTLIKRCPRVSSSACGFRAQTHRWTTWTQ